MCKYCGVDYGKCGFVSYRGLSWVNKRIRCISYTLDYLDLVAKSTLKSNILKLRFSTSFYDAGRTSACCEQAQSATKSCCTWKGVKGWGTDVGLKHEQVVLRWRPGRSCAEVRWLQPCMFFLWNWMLLSYSFMQVGWPMHKWSWQ